MISNKIGYIWSPLFLLLGLYELFVSESLMHMMMGHSSSITGQMWFMWLMMSLSASGRYIDMCFCSSNCSKECSESSK